uniref:Uncharacterized protein n=1 Tax=Anguilla anguilla TaxID=7936 RepID=A0A0E9R1D2_ANGAN
MGAPSLISGLKAPG